MRRVSGGVLGRWRADVSPATKVDYPAAVFNRANMKTDEYKMTYEATLPGGYDGVQVSRRSPDQRTIRHTSITAC